MTIPEAGQGVTALSMENLCGVGLSRNKALAVQDLAEKSLDGTLMPMRRMSRLAMTNRLSRDLCLVRGIGPWTAQMFLMFNLGRPDVMPATDLGVQKGVQAVYAHAGLPSPEQVVQQHAAPCALPIRGELVFLVGGGYQIDDLKPAPRAHLGGVNLLDQFVLQHVQVSLLKAKLVRVSKEPGSQEAKVELNLTPRMLQHRQRGEAAGLPGQRPAHL